MSNRRKIKRPRPSQWAKWSAAATMAGIDEAKKAAYDALVAELGDRPRDFVNYKWWPAAEARQALTDLGQIDQPEIIELVDWLEAQPDGVLVMAWCWA